MTEAVRDVSSASEEELVAFSQEMNTAMAKIFLPDNRNWFRLFKKVRRNRCDRCNRLFKKVRCNRCDR